MPEEQPQQNHQQPVLTAQTEKPHHYTYLKEFRVEPCPLFKQHQCTQHRPYTCFHWHFPNQRRRRPVRRKDGTFNYSPDIYCTKYDENTGTCLDGNDCPFLHRVAGDVERKYHLRYYKTCLCVHNTDAKGNCVKNGPHCAFGHGPNDLRPPVYDIREQQQLQSGSPPAEGDPLLDSNKTCFVVEEPVWQDTNYVLANYKTDSCKKPPRLCRQGYACPYYHNNKDRRRAPANFKDFMSRSTPCPSVKHGDEWGDPETCDQGDACSYCHTRTEQQFHPEVYKTTKCNDMMQHGYCPRGPFCAFAHTDVEIGADREVAIKSGTCLAQSLAASSSSPVSPTGLVANSGSVSIGPMGVLRKESIGTVSMSLAQIAENEPADGTVLFDAAHGDGAATNESGDVLCVLRSHSMSSGSGQVYPNTLMQRQNSNSSTNSAGMIFGDMTMSSTGSLTGGNGAPAVGSYHAAAVTNGGGNGSVGYPQGSSPSYSSVLKQRHQSGPSESKSSNRNNCEDSTPASGCGSGMLEELSTSYPRAIGSEREHSSLPTRNWIANPASGINELGIPVGEDNDAIRLKASLYLQHDMGTIVGTPPQPLDAMRSPNAGNSECSAFAQQAIHSSKNTVESVVHNVMDDLTLDELSLEKLAHHERDESESLASSLSQYTASSLYSSSAPMTIPGSQQLHGLSKLYCDSPQLAQNSGANGQSGSYGAYSNSDDLQHSGFRMSSGSFGNNSLFGGLMSPDSQESGLPMRHNSVSGRLALDPSNYIAELRKYQEQQRILREYENRWGQMCKVIESFRHQLEEYKRKADEAERDKRDALLQRDEACTRATLLQHEFMRWMHAAYGKDVPLNMLEQSQTHLRGLLDKIEQKIPPNNRHPANTISGMFGQQHQLPQQGGLAGQQAAFGGPMCGRCGRQTNMSGISYGGSSGHCVICSPGSSPGKNGEI